MSEPVQLQVDLDALRKRQLFVAVPAYSNNMCSTFVKSLIDMQRTLHQYGIPHAIQFIYNESLISRARNTLADLFLQSECTDMLFIDSDIEFEPQDPILLMHYNRELIGANYPLKSISWERIKQALVKNPNIEPAALSKAGATWSAHCLGAKVDLVPFVPLEVNELATGFMMIKREVFETLKPLVPQHDPPETEKTASRPGYDFFTVGVHNRRYESEDYSFCRRWRETGGKIWVCPWMSLTHYGAYGFPGNMHECASILGELH